MQQGAAVPQYSYRASDAEGHYLRLATLDRFDKNRFLSSPLVPDPGVDPTSATLTLGGVNPSVASLTLSTVVTISSQLGNKTLPIPTTTTRLDGLEGPWFYQQSSASVFSAGKDGTRDQHFTATSKVLTPQPSQLQASKPVTAADADYASVAADLAVPAGLPAVVKDKALTLTKSDSTPYEKAVELQNWFLDPQKFSYSLTGPGGGGYQPLVAFLTTHRSGYCQQFAAAMAIMARTLKIPARVATGFTTGVHSGNSGTYQVDSHDAHAWPELYFEGIGWLRFEPTPRGDNQTDPPSYSDLAVSDIKAMAQATATSTAGPRDPVAPKPVPTRAAGAATSTGGHTSHGSSLPIRGRPLASVLVLVALLLLILALPLLRGAARRRRLRATRDPRAVALLAWRETMRDAYDLGHPPLATDSPRQAARRLTQSAGLTGTAAAALERLARAVERARYAPQPGDPSGLLDAATTVSGAMYAGAPQRVRMRAKMLPPTSTREAADGLARSLARLSAWAGRRLGRPVSYGNRLLRRPARGASAQPEPSEDRKPAGVGGPY